MLYLCKTPGSKKVFSYKVPPYNDNKKVHTELGCPCLVGVEVEVGGNDRGAAAGYQIDDLPENVLVETPSKVRRISGDEPQESPVDKLTAREVKRKTPARLHIKFEHTKRKIMPGNIAVQDSQVKKIFTSNDSFLTYIHNYVALIHFNQK